jgi:alkylation response protein AidB-like acyl-CoA dehydrogenase
VEVSSSRSRFPLGRSASEIVAPAPSVTPPSNTRDSEMSTELAIGLYDIPQEMVDFRETIRQIATEKIAPRAADIDRNAEYPHDIRKFLGE